MKKRKIISGALLALLLFGGILYNRVQAPQSRETVQQIKEEKAETMENKERSAEETGRKQAETVSEEREGEQTETTSENVTETIQTEIAEKQNTVQNQISKDSREETKGRISQEGEQTETHNRSESFSFPGMVEEEVLQAVELVPYDGIFVEDGTNQEVSRVAAITLKNLSKQNIQYGELHFQVEGKGEAAFVFSNLPAEASILVFEQSRLTYDESDRYVLGDHILAYMGEMEKLEGEFEITAQGENQVILTNLTAEDRHNIRIFYKYRYDEGIYVGGITFTANIEEIKAGDSVTIQPAHFESEGCEILMVRTYET